VRAAAQRELGLDLVQLALLVLGGCAPLVRVQYRKGVAARVDML